MIPREKREPESDMNPIINEYRHPYLFYFLATAVPWACWGLAARISHLPGYAYAGELASLLAFAGLLSPLLVACALVGRSPRLMGDLRSRLVGLRGGKPVYWLLTLLLMPASILLAQLVSVAFGYPASQFAFSEHYSFTSGVFPVWFLLLAAPLIEELAWHSYGTDCLRSRFSLFGASMLFALFWGIWHLPLSLINDYYHSNLLETGWIHSLNFLVSLFPFVILMNWLYYRTGRSVLAAVVFHVTAGYFNEIFATHPDSKVIQTGLLTVLAVFVVLRESRLFFARGIPLATAGESATGQHPQLNLPVHW
jgi:membrane protease YdiL (CAAX protease family)